MRTQVPEKLLAILDEIDSQGHASLTRLAVLKKWFETPGRLPAFGLWVARRAAGRKGKTKAEAGALLNEARSLLGTTATRESFTQSVDRGAAQTLHHRARGILHEHQQQSCGSVRIIHCWPLLLVEKGLALYLGESAPPADGYKLAADFCQHHDSRLSNCLCGPSRTKVLEIVRFMFNLEAVEV